MPVLLCYFFELLMLIDVIAQLGLGALGKQDCLVSLSRLSVVVMAHLSGVDEVIGELWGSSCLH